jgi:hypothetical protein
LVVTKIKTPKERLPKVTQRYLIEIQSKVDAHRPSDDLKVSFSRFTTFLKGAKGKKGTELLKFIFEKPGYIFATDLCALIELSKQKKMKPKLINFRAALITTLQRFLNAWDYIDSGSTTTLKHTVQGTALTTNWSLRGDEMNPRTKRFDPVTMESVFKKIEAEIKDLLGAQAASSP